MKAILLGAALALSLPLSADPTAKTEPKKMSQTLPQTTAVPSTAEIRPLIEEFEADFRSVSSLYKIDFSPARRARLSELYRKWQNRLQAVPFASLKGDDRVDYVLFHRYLEHELRSLANEEEQAKRWLPYVPFAQTVVDLEEARMRMQPLDPAHAAEVVTGLTKAIDESRKRWESATNVDKLEAGHAADIDAELRTSLKRWFDYYNGYDPMFTWWMAEPFKAADHALEQYGTFLKEKLVGLKAGDDRTILGHPVGRAALAEALDHEMIPYTPEEVIAIGEREFAWCEAEMKKASRELGYGDDWKAALEHVKKMYVEPGKQPEMVHGLAVEAIQFVESRHLVTVPPLAKETWRMEMMSPDRQRVNPFFLGGETIIVSFPTDTMTQEEKMMSMRGNNVPFSRATVQHELIPGHHLQGFMWSRYKPYRRIFSTPFCIEGWALYWEMLLWDLHFPRTPEERIGMLFWRMHRCARIVFSLKFHLGQMTAQECVDMLVNRVGHERANAEGEVRRSFNGTYPPLYQAAYMLGGLQFRAMHKELVESGKMTDQQFHDAILKENDIPPALIRAVLLKQEITPDLKPTWRFANE